MIGHVVTTHGLSQAQWVSRFLEQLAQLKPTPLSADEQLASARDAYAQAGDLLPELAAQIFALDLPASRGDASHAES